MEYKKSFRIAGLIAKSIFGNLTDKEKKELSVWKNINSNNELFTAILSEDEFIKRQKKANKISVDKEYTKFSYKTSQQKPIRKQLFGKTLHYAAAILIPVALAMGVWFLTQDEFSNNSTYSGQIIPPGEREAELILSDGRVVPLNIKTTSQLKEVDGTSIINSEAKLTYQKKQNIKENKSQQLYNTLNTKRGKEYFVELSDGTKAWVNSMSSLKYPVTFDKKTRTVELSGEAYFEVAKDNDRPFYVKVNDYTLKVLGTSFNISSYKNDDLINTTLIEGSVEINSVKGIPGETYLLKPDQQFSFNKSSLEAEIKEVNASIYITWMQGRFNFDEEYLEDIFRIFERWYNIEVFFIDDAAKKEIFTGDLPRFEDMNTILHMIDHVSNVKFKVENNVIQIFKNK
jgi:ferric-dicitrate binding protein FerR (iron transport regulator)